MPNRPPQTIADEGHRSQSDFIDGFAKRIRDTLPKASFIGFTGTSIESGDKNTQAVFGDYIDVYDILQSEEDKAAVPIYYEARLAKIDLKPEERLKIDPNFEEVTEDAEESTGIYQGKPASEVGAVGSELKSAFISVNQRFNCLRFLRSFAADRIRVHRCSSVVKILCASASLR